MGLSRVCEPLTVKNVVIPNRIVFPAFQTNFATVDGFVTERLIRMYKKIAQGGSGLIIGGGIAVSDDGAPNTNALKATRDEHISGLREFFSVIKETGAVPGAQLMHAGRQTLSVMTGLPIVAPSAIPCPVMKEKPVGLDIKGIKRIQDDFVKAAVRVKDAGAEVIELHGAFGYLIGGFLSPFSNERNDEYGRDRSLFFTEIIRKLKPMIGNVPISCRISGDEYVDGGLTLNDTREIAKRLVAVGVDIISVAAGTYASMEHMTMTMEMGQGLHVHLAEAIKDVVDVPVICSDNIRSLEFSDKIISEKRSDLVAICRAQVADPLFVRKSKNNEPINKCIDCGDCLFFLKGGRSVSCPQNPEL